MRQPSAPVHPSSSQSDVTGSRPWKRKRTADPAQEGDKKNHNNRRVDGKGAVAENGANKPRDIEQPRVVPKPVVEIPSGKSKPLPLQRLHTEESPNSQIAAGEPTKKPAPSSTPSNKTPQKPNRAHGSEKKQTLTGFFTSEEVQQLENFKLEFCNTNGLSSHTFDSMVQHSDRDKGSEFPCDSSITNKQDFWRTIYESIPQRDRRSVYRFMRRHFQASTQKPHQWTHEQDEELVSLHTQHGPKWAYIAKLVGRSDDDVVQRWKNRLEYRTTMLRGPWSAEEIRGLQDALQASWKAMRDAGKDVGKDIYEMDESLVGWGQVSDRIQHIRSRQQCADKWRRIRRKVLDQRARGDPEATYEPTTGLRSPKKPKPAPITMAQEPPKESKYKSSEYVDSEDEGEGDDGQDISAVPAPSKAPAKQSTAPTEKALVEPEKEAFPVEMETSRDPTPEGRPEPGPEPNQKPSAETRPYLGAESKAEAESGTESESGSDSDDIGTRQNKNKSSRGSAMKDKSGDRKARDEQPKPVNVPVRTAGQTVKHKNLRNKFNPKPNPNQTSKINPKPLLNHNRSR